MRATKHSRVRVSGMRVVYIIEFEVAPGADPAQVAAAFEAANPGWKVEP